MEYTELPYLIYAFTFEKDMFSIMAKKNYLYYELSCSILDIFMRLMLSQKEKAVFLADSSYFSDKVLETP